MATGERQMSTAQHALLTSIYVLRICCAGNKAETSQ